MNYKDYMKLKKEGHSYYLLMPHKWIIEHWVKAHLVKHAPVVTVCIDEDTITINAGRKTLNDSVEK